MRSICLGGVASVETRGAVKNACELQDRTKEVPVGNVVAVELVSVDGVMESPEEWAFSYSNEKMEEANAAGLSAYGPHETSGTPMVDYVNSGTRRVPGRELPRKERP
jgi:hypothetical protein